MNGLIVLAKRKQGYSEISTNLQTIFDRISALSLIRFGETEKQQKQNQNENDPDVNVLVLVMEKKKKKK